MFFYDSILSFVTVFFLDETRIPKFYPAIHDGQINKLRGFPFDDNGIKS